MKQRADGRWRKVKRINGKEITFYSKAKTEKAANKDIENQMLQYVENLTRQKSFKEIAEIWSEEHQDEVGYKTWQGYQAHYKRAITEFGDHKIAEIQCTRF